MFKEELASYGLNDWHLHSITDLNAPVMPWRPVPTRPLSDAVAYGALPRPYKVEKRNGAETMSGQSAAEFTDWWNEVIGRVPSSCKAKITVELGWRLWCLAQSHKNRGSKWEPRIHPWTNVIARSMRELDALNVIARKLGGKALKNATSYSGLSVDAPLWLEKAGGRDLVRLSRLSPGFLRWLHSHQWDSFQIDAAGVDWEALSKKAQDYRAIAAEDDLLSKHGVGRMYVRDAKHVRMLDAAPAERQEAISSAMNALVAGNASPAEQVVLGEKPVNIYPGLTRREAAAAVAEDLPPCAVLSRMRHGLVGPSGRHGWPCAQGNPEAYRWAVEALRDSRRSNALYKDRSGICPVTGETLTYQMASMLDHLTDADISHPRESVHRVWERQESRIKQEMKARIMRVPDDILASWPEALPPCPSWAKWLNSPRDLMREGEEMSHCVGYQAGIVRSGLVVILSVRDADGASTVKINAKDGTVSEHRGAKNSAPPESHSERVKSWIGDLASPDLEGTQ